MTAVTGRVLTKEEIQHIEVKLKTVDDSSFAYSYWTPNLIATIRDRDKTIAYKNELLNDLGKTCVIQQQQNTILREALQMLQQVGGEVAIICRNALREASTPDEPNRNAQTE